MSRYDGLSPRALWFLQNFDELTLAEMCATNEAAGHRPAPAGRREQLPDDVLALLSSRSYLSTACDTARRIDAATIRHPENADLPAWVEQLHARCRLNHKFTGEPCYCRCHKETT